MILMKFGGSTMADTVDIRRVANIITSKISENPVVVLSAFKGVTDLLVSVFKEPSRSEEIIRNIRDIHLMYARELNVDSLQLKKLLEHCKKYTRGIIARHDFSDQSRDQLLSFGERFSVLILANYLNTLGIEAEPSFSDELGFITNNRFGAAEIIPEGISRIRSNVPKIQGVPIITGFIGKTRLGQVTTVGRSGSDYTATVIGAALNVQEVQFWTDVAGVLTADPNLVKSAKSVDFLTFDEAAELAYFGTKFLHSRCIYPAMKNKIPLRILSTQKPGEPGTLISFPRGNDAPDIKVIVYKDNLNLLTVSAQDPPMSYGFLVELFHIFNRYRISADSVATTENSVSLTIGKNMDDIPSLLQEIENCGKVTLKPECAVVSLIGEGITREKGLATSIVELFKNIRIPVHMFSRNPKKLNLTCVIDQQHIKQAIECLHKKIFDEKNAWNHIFHDGEQHEKINRNVQ